MLIPENLVSQHKYMYSVMIPVQHRHDRSDLLTLFRALDKREYLVIIRDNFCLFCFEPYVVTPHLNRLDETVQMRGHNIWF